jgi:hypothetical protein
VSLVVRREEATMAGPKVWVFFYGSYICSEMTSRPADDADIERNVGLAREFGFPKWYVDRLESFRI